MLNKEKNSFSIIFALALCIVAAGLLSLTADALRPKQIENARIDKQKNILIALKIGEGGQLDTTEGINTYYSEKASTKDIDQLFADYVQSIVVNVKTGKEEDMKASEIGDNADLREVFVQVDPQTKNRIAYCLPISGKGLWSTIKGFIAIKAEDIQKGVVKGITFYSHGETPGLGARIEEAWFLANFVGKHVFADNGELKSITIAKAEADPNSMHDVDGISGATLTCVGVNIFLKKDLQAFEKFLKIQGGQ